MFHDMANRRLTLEELARVNVLLDHVRADLAALAGDDRELLFAARRRVVVRLSYDERSTPAERTKLKALKRREQANLCAFCKEPLPEKYAELDRINASDGYTGGNTRLVHHNCHVEDQAAKGYL